MIEKFYQGVATGEYGYTKGKTYTGYLEHKLVTGKYVIMFKADHHWHFVPADIKGVAKFYQGIATGERKYKKGKKYTGYLAFDPVSDGYAIKFEDDHGWNFVPVVFESIAPVEQQLELNLG